MANQEKSLLWVVAMVMIVIVLFGWAFLAAGYAHHAEGWRSGGAEAAGDRGEIGSTRGRRGATSSMRRVAASSMADFVANAFRQIPNFPKVIAFGFQHRLWLIGLFGGLEALVLFGGWKLRGLDRELADHPDAVYRRRQRPKSSGKTKPSPTGRPRKRRA